MSLFQKPIQRKLSALLATQVTFQRLDVSLLGGSLDAHGLTIAGNRPGDPVLTVKRVRAEIAVARVLRGEVIVKSLTIERPILSIVRRADGSTNVPCPTRTAAEAADDVDGAPASSSTSAKSQRAGGDEGSAAEDLKREWKFDAGRILLVDGEAHFRDRSVAGGGYHVSAAPVLADLTHRDGVVEITCILESVGRRDVPAELGEVKMVVRLEGVADLARAAWAAATASIDVANDLRISAESDALSGGSPRSRGGRAVVEGSVDLRRWRALLPPTTPGFVKLGLAEVAGAVTISGQVAYDPQAGLRVPTMKVQACDVFIGRAGEET